MFSLVLDRSKFYKIKYGQNATQVRQTFKMPINEVFSGKIICIDSTKYFEYSVKVGETYCAIAKKFGVDKELLKKINEEKPIYPTCKIFVPELRA
ncbi:MAG: hypothetical protein E7370_02790 [Clostridiales bacterium]|nr:hypothetical protein [Clostridiales bacterium]